MLRKYRKTALIEAEQYLPEIGQRPLGPTYDVSPNGVEYVYIKTLEGVMTVSPGDWVARGPKGEYWPIKPDIFAATYEEVV